MTVSIKVVPDDSPNAKGHWIKTDRALPKVFPFTLNYDKTITALAGVIPEGHHIVSIQRDDK